MLEINLPQIVSELTAAFEAYEDALTGNDIPRVNEFFWNAPDAVRFGTRESERQYGYDEIAAFRIKRGAVDQRRLLRNRMITTFGRDLGIANVEFIPHGSDKVGRQSQTWIRTASGWKIAGAHVSFGA